MPARSRAIVGIWVTNVAQFGVSSAGGGITNSGMISETAYGIVVDSVTDFPGGISNSGTISAGSQRHLRSLVSQAFPAGSAIPA